MMEQWILCTMFDLLHRSATPSILPVLPTMPPLAQTVEGLQAPLYQVPDNNASVF